MKKPTPISKRLAQYTSMAGAFLAASSAHAQIVYTDLNPDVVVDAAHPEFDLDLNNDGNFEFVFSVDVFGINQDYFSMYMVNAFDYDGSRMLVYPAVNGGGDAVRNLDYGYAINGNAERWRANGFLARHFYNNDNSYPWANTEAYVGFKFHFDLESGNHFGWARIAVNTDPENPTITIKDYAYNATTGKKILAGEGAPSSCSDSFEPNNTFSQATTVTLGQPVFSMINPSDDRDFYQFTVEANQSNLRVVLSNLPKNYDMHLYDASKQLLAKAKNNKTENDTIVLNNAAAGTYYVKVYQKDNLSDAADCYVLKAETSSSPLKISAGETDAAEVMDVRLFPNPANQFLTLQFDEETTSEIPVTIFDLEGRETMSTVLPAGETSSQLNISSLTSGMYLVKAVIGNEVVMKKFSVVK
jgi:hypothetical protein